MSSRVRMVDVTAKPTVYREAVATGKIRLKKSTIELIREGKVEKGDVLSVATVAAVLAAKRTPEDILLAHPIPVTGVDVSFDFGEDYVQVTVRVRTIAQTGCEMEALNAVVAALLNIWDMVKKYEKDESGQYPTTEIFDVRVVSKVKREL